MIIHIGKKYFKRYLKKLYLMVKLYLWRLFKSVWAAELTDCFSAEALTLSNEYPGYDDKQSDHEAPLMLELWGMQSTP